MKRISIAFALALMTAMMCMLAGCGGKTIDGDWIIFKEENADGSIFSREYLEEKGILEEYHIEGDAGTYTCHLMGKDIGFDIDVIDKGNGTYDFMIGDILFQTVTFKGDTFTYVVGEGQDAQTFVFERKK